MNWENITVKDNQYIRVESVKVKVPLSNGEDLEFVSKDAELIHIAINGNAICNSWEFDKWYEHLRKVLLQKQIPTTAKCLFEHWNCYAIQFAPFDFKECSIAEKESYIYSQRDKQFEFSNGNTHYAYKQYSDLSAENSDLLKPYIKAVLH